MDFPGTSLPVEAGSKKNNGLHFVTIASHACIMNSRLGKASDRSSRKHPGALARSEAPYVVSLSKENVAVTLVSRTCSENNNECINFKVRVFAYLPAHFGLSPDIADERHRNLMAKMRQGSRFQALEARDQLLRPRFRRFVSMTRQKTQFPCGAHLRTHSICM